MLIKKISIENFKSYKMLEMDLEQFNVLIGPNAAGKSNCIQSLKFFRDLAVGGLKNAISLQGGTEYLRNINIGSEGGVMNFNVVFSPDKNFKFNSEKVGNEYYFEINEFDYRFSLELKTETDSYNIIDDELFFRSVIAPIFYDDYDDVEIIQYAQTKKEKVDLFLKSIKTLKFDYILFGDIDYFDGVNQKKRQLNNRFSVLDYDMIVVVIQEIESWYIAGLTDEKSREFGLKPMSDTDNLIKEEFNRLYHNKFQSRIDFMLEILKNYSLETATDKNRSFSYFYNRYLNNN